MPNNLNFPKTLPYIGTVLGRRAMGKPEPGYLTYRPSSKTEILSLRPDGTRTTKVDPTASFGLYTWNGECWELERVYDSVHEADRAAARFRRQNSK
jgi:hypothetical protein